MANSDYRAVLWDFGGVLTDSPFDAFQEYEAANGLPRDFIRGLNARNADDNAWARFERNEIALDEFDRLFAEEAAAFGYRIRGHDVVRLLYGRIRPAMVKALRTCGEHYRNACLTNNINTGSGHGLPTSDDRAEEVARVLGMFDLVIESRKVGVRKPEPEFYRIALESLGIDARQAVYLDDLGINLKPARALGMTTIKVDQPAAALAELGAVLDLTFD